MKLFKRISAMFLAVLMTVATFGTTTAFAAEDTANEETVWVDGGYIETTNTNRYDIARDTFNMTGSHNGGIRTYNYNYVGFNFLAFKQTGGFLDNTVVAVRLYDITTNQLVHEWQTNSTIDENAYPITYGHRYQFRYLVAYGTQDIQIFMNIFGRL